jgi:hypothetical protein
VVWYRRRGRRALRDASGRSSRRAARGNETLRPRGGGVVLGVGRRGLRRVHVYTGPHTTAFAW